LPSSIFLLYVCFTFYLYFSTLYMFEVGAYIISCFSLSQVVYLSSIFVFLTCLCYLSFFTCLCYLSFIYVWLICPNDRQSVWLSVFPCLYSLSICPYVITNLCLCLVSLFSFYCSLYYVTSSAFCLRLTVLYPCWLPLPFHLFLSQPHTSFND
jgi:hypothetical protein